MVYFGQKRRRRSSVRYICQYIIGICFEIWFNSKNEWYVRCAMLCYLTFKLVTESISDKPVYLPHFLRGNMLLEVKYDSDVIEYN